ncbi:MAG: glycosyltransferase family 2 protein [Alphaproteobacteria bacterium]|nr:glycosyltransferase family 2 protein [Alphaproteobacteria bacterium]
MSRDSVSIVISAFNEEENIPELYKQLKKVLQKISVKKTEIIFVDDGSSDRTAEICAKLQKRDKCVRLLRLSRNFGHEIAMTAGMDYATGEAVIFMDADLQHPPKYIPEMISLWQKGSNVVLTRRLDNLEKKGIYKLFSKSFYWVLNKLSDVSIAPNTPDFRLLDREYIEFLKKFNEHDRLFRGMLSWIKPRDVTYVDFVAPNRFAGKTKYNFFKSVSLAITSIIQFSVKPLYLSLILAIITGVISLLFGVYVIVEYFLLSHRTPGYATIMTTIFFMGSLQLFMFAILGAYIAKIHTEVKKRPLYCTLDSKKDKND